MTTSLLRVNNILNKPLTGNGITLQGTYSDKSMFESSLNYPLTLPKNAKIGLLDCSIELSNDYIIVETDSNQDIDYITVQIDEKKYSTYLLPGKYKLETFKNMLEWSLNGCMDFRGLLADNYETGFNFSCPLYTPEQVNLKNILKIQWDRSDPVSQLDEENLDILFADFDDLNSSITSEVLEVGDGAVAYSNQYFTKGCGTISATLGSLDGMSADNNLFCMGLSMPSRIPNNSSADDETKAIFFGVMVGTTTTAGFTDLKYRLITYPTVSVKSNEYLQANCITDIDIYMRLTTPNTNEDLQLNELILFDDGFPLSAVEGDIISIQASTDINDKNSIGGNYYIIVERGDDIYQAEIIYEKSSFLQWNMNNVNITKEYTNPNDNITRSYNLQNQDSIKDLVGTWIIYQSNYTVSNMKMTTDPFHIVDPANNTHVNLRDHSIDLKQPVLRDILACNVSFDFREYKIWNDLFQFQSIYYLFRLSTRGEITGVRPIDYYRLRFPINILIDNMDLNSYDTSIKDKENLLYCLSESNLTDFNEDRISSVRYVCQNQPLMISLRNKNPITLNKLKMRLTDNYYRTFDLNPNIETHLNLLISEGELLKQT
jgi:hypothetical protein